MGDLVYVFWFDQYDQPDTPQGVRGHLLIVDVIANLEGGADLGQPLLLTDAAFL